MRAQRRGTKITSRWRGSAARASTAARTRVRPPPAQSPWLRWGAAAWKLAKSIFEVVVVLIAWKTLTEMHAQTNHSFQAIAEARVQNQKLQAQNDALQVQIALQKEQDYIARRAELFATLYDRKETCDQSERDRSRQCPLKAALRSRQEALKAFVRIEGEREAPDRSLADVDAPEVDLGSADLSHANLEYADLRGARLTHANLTGSNLQNANLAGADLTGADLAGARLGAASLSGAKLLEAQLEHAQLKGANLRYAIVTGARLAEADLESADLRDAYVDHAHLAGAVLRRTDFCGATLDGADLETADLTDADLHQSSLRNAKLTGALLCGADLRETTGLLGAQLERAVADSSTRTSGDIVIRQLGECRKDTAHRTPTCREAKRSRHLGCASAAAVATLRRPPIVSVSCERDASVTEVSGTTQTNVTGAYCHGCEVRRCERVAKRRDRVITQFQAIEFASTQAERRRWQYQWPGGGYAFDADWKPEGSG